VGVGPGRVPRCRGRVLDGLSAFLASTEGYRVLARCFGLALFSPVDSPLRVMFPKPLPFNNRVARSKTPPRGLSHRKEEERKMIVVNQQKWDGSGPERITAMESRR
jgi:hypothetical protein